MAACPICMAEESNPCKTDCGHSFCHDCVVTWASKRTQPTCPLCTAPITQLVLHDGTLQAVRGAAPSSLPDEGPDLDCLDHSYFLAEVTRLLSRARSTYDRLVRDACTRGSGGGGADSAQLVEGAQRVLALLQSHREGLMREGRFDPHNLLEDLYRLERAVNSLASGRLDELTELEVETDVAADTSEDEDWEEPANTRRKSQKRRSAQRQWM